ncbi:unknown [Subdoligranulum sp. CAG:314]|nr:unknown [Subdoligranulum sp. CAG:314]
MERFGQIRRGALSDTDGCARRSVQNHAGFGFAYFKRWRAGQKVAGFCRPRDRRRPTRPPCRDGRPVACRGQCLRLFGVERFYFGKGRKMGIRFRQPRFHGIRRQNETLQAAGRFFGLSFQAGTDQSRRRALRLYAGQLSDSACRRRRTNLVFANLYGQRGKGEKGRRQARDLY